MLTMSVLLAVVLGAFGPIELPDQKRGAATATLVVVVSDPDGNPLPGVLVTVDGPAGRSTRTERGRAVFEKLPPGTYRLRFEGSGFIVLERELTARAGKPIDVPVTLTPLPAPPAPPAPEDAPEPPPPSPGAAKPLALNLPATIEKNFIGRAPQRISTLACGNHGTATLIQLNEPLAQHAHDGQDEFLYVIAGEGVARLHDREEGLRAGVLVFVPSGVPHTLMQTGRNPLILLSARAGEGCRPTP